MERPSQRASLCPHQCGQRHATFVSLDVREGWIRTEQSGVNNHNQGYCASWALLSAYTGGAKGWY